MYPAIRDAMLRGIYPTLREGARDLGIDAVELELAPDLALPDPEGDGRLPVWDDAAATAYRARLEDAGLRACALLTAADLGTGGVGEHAAWLERAVRIADVLGAAAVRVDPLMRAEAEIGFDARADRVAEVLDAVIARTPGCAAALALENHGPGGNSPVFLLTVLNAVDHPRAGLALDTGNFYWRGFPRAEVHAIARLFAPRVRHTHLKNIRFPADKRDLDRPAGWEYAACCCGLAEGDLDLARVVDDLRAAGYTGALCIENEALGKAPDDAARRDALRRDAGHVRALLA